MSCPKELLGNINGGIILDVGTGDGAFLRFLINNLASFDKMIGIDLDPQMIASAQKAFQDDRISFSVISGDNLPYEDNSFGTVSISNSLHHLSDITKTLSEMKRVLKPGGYLIINELFCDGQNEKQLTHVYFHHFQAEIETILGVFHNKSFEKQKILEIADSLGLKEIKEVVYQNEIFNKYVQKDMFRKHYEALLEKIKDRPDFSIYLKKFDELTSRLDRVGVEFASQLLVAGIK